MDKLEKVIRESITEDIKNLEYDLFHMYAGQNRTTFNKLRDIGFIDNKFLDSALDSFAISQARRDYNLILNPKRNNYDFSIDHVLGEPAFLAYGISKGHFSEEELAKLEPYLEKDQTPSSFAEKYGRDNFLIPYLRNLLFKPAYSSDGKKCTACDYYDDREHPGC